MVRKAKARRLMELTGSSTVEQPAPIAMKNETPRRAPRIPLKDLLSGRGAKTLIWLLSCQAGVFHLFHSAVLRWL